MLYVKDFRNTPAVTVEPTATLKECLEIMERENFRHLLITENEMLVGIVVRKDIEGALRQPSRYPETPVDWIMSKKPITIEDEAPLINALKLMVEYKFSGLPVMKGNKVVGMLTETDVVKALISILEKQ
jgi:acetoin utilization protein AcuB